MSKDTGHKHRHDIPVEWEEADCVRHERLNARWTEITKLRCACGDEVQRKVAA